jgi:hypothetical protein
MTIMRIAREGYEIDDDVSRLDVDAIHAFLSSAYWSAGIPRKVVSRSIAGSLSFGRQGDFRLAHRCLRAA